MSSSDLSFRVRGILPDGTAHDLQPVITDDGVTVTLTLPNSQRQSPRWQTVTVESSLTQARGGEPGYMFYPTTFAYGVVMTRFTEGRPDGSIASLIAAMPVCGFRCETPAAVFVHVRGDVANSRFRISCRQNDYRIAIEFLQDGDEPDEEIRVEYRRMPGATYSDMARHYRQYQLTERGCVPIRERIRRQPLLRRALEAIEIRVRMGWKPLPTPVRRQTVENEPPMHIACTVGDLNRIVDTLQAQGVRHAELCLVGWGPGGHDGRFPQQTPCDERFGGDRELIPFIRRAQQLGYLVVCHTVSEGAYEIADNWNPAYLTKVKAPDGSIIPYLRAEYKRNGLNGGDPWHVCARCAYEVYAKTTLPKVRDYGFQGLHYNDELTAVKPEKCCDPNHPVNRRQALHYHHEIARYEKELFGGFQSESWMDYMNADVDYALYTSVQSWPSASHNPLFDEGIPFWQLTYHGIVMSNASSQTVNWPLKEKAQELKHIEYGSRPVMYFNSKFGEDRNWMGDVDLFDRTPEQLAQAGAAIRKAYDAYEALKALQYEFMEDHTRLAPGVYRVTYSDGTVITVDYNALRYDITPGKALTEAEAPTAP